MIKRYNVFGGEDGFDWDYEVDRNGSWCLYDDIKDSLIEWHKIEDGLPEANDLPVIVEHKDPGYWRKHPYEILTGATVIRRAFTYKRWTYIIPPKE